MADEPGRHGDDAGNHGADHAAVAPQVRPQLRAISGAALGMFLLVLFAFALATSVGVLPVLAAMVLAIPVLTLLYVAVAAGGSESTAAKIGGATFAAEVAVPLALLIPAIRYSGLVLAFPAAVLTFAGLSAMVVAVLPPGPGENRGRH